MRPDLERLLEGAIGRLSAGTCAPMRAALLMHGNEADPVFCYVNHTAQPL